MQLNKSIKIFFNYFLGPVLFTWLLFSTYRQIQAQPHLQASWLHIKQSFHTYKVYYLVSVVLLMFVNWGIEALKWKVAITDIYPLHFWSAYKAILSGVAFSVNTPNRMGEYVGRIMYVPEGSRLKTVPVTLICSLSQLLITVGAGTVSFFVLRTHLVNAGILNWMQYRFMITGLLLGWLLFVLIYIGTAGIVKIIGQWFKNSRHLYLVQALQNFTTPLLFQLAGLSVVRFCVFIVQYFLLFRLFEVNVSIATVGWVMSIVFLAMAVIPSITLVEVGLRGQVSLQVMGLFAANRLGIGLTSVTAWFINLLLPAIAGSLLILGLKVFKRRNEIL